MTTVGFPNYVWLLEETVAEPETEGRQLTSWPEVFTSIPDIYTYLARRLRDMRGMSDEDWQLTLPSVKLGDTLFTATLRTNWPEKEYRQQLRYLFVAKQVPINHVPI